MGFLTSAMLVIPLLLVSGLVSGQHLFSSSQTCNIGDGTDLTETSEVDYFEDICFDFQICTSGQFAVLTVGKLEEKQLKPSIPKNKSACIELMQKSDKNDVNVAVPKDVDGKKIHTEKLLLDELTKMAAWKKEENKNIVVDVYMFTFLSPCSNCSKELLNRIQVQEKPSIRLHFSWQDYFHEKPNYASNFFQSLTSLFSLKDKIILAYENTGDDSKCRNKKRLSYQYIYYNCLIKKVTKVKNCNEMKSDWAKFVNKLTFTCIKDMDAGGQQLRHCIDEFTSQFQNVNKQPVLECNPAGNKPPNLGPPLLPENPEFGSQSLVDLEGKYASGDFCFK